MLGFILDHGKWYAARLLIRTYTKQGLQMGKQFDAQGVIHSIGQTTEYGQNGFTKREFVIKLTGEGENPDYPNYVALELIKDKCAIMDDYNVGDEVIAHFNLSGRLWTAPGKPERCFTSLQAWRVERAGNAAPQGGPAPMDSNPFGSSDFDDNVPF